MILLAEQLYENFDASILKKTEFFSGMDKYIYEFEGLEKFFRCLKD